MSAAYLSLGCNLGDCRHNLAEAVGRLGGLEGTRVTAVSSLYLTEPVGDVEQPDFLNMALGLETELPARELHRRCRAIEEALGGREGRTPGGPRTLDIDILLYEGERMAGDDLTIPHPRMLERAFVLVPMNEIAAGEVVPGDGTIGEALGALRDGARVRLSGRLEETGGR
jgi:2-amino-4-hydroxy-6-hydroxymethyldihydropteridine diphosphokinase